MELKTKFNPGSEVHFMLANKIVQGTVRNLGIRAYLDQDKPIVKTKYNVNYKFKVEVDSSSGFAGNQNTERESNYDIEEEFLFSSKEELISSL